MKEKVWLSRPKSKKHWHYGLARYADGSIRVSEILFCDGFGEVGTRWDPNSDFASGKTIPTRLERGEREMICRDLYLACCRELSIDPSQDAIDDWSKETPTDR